MLSTRAPAQVAQSVEQWTEKAFQSALPLSPEVLARFRSKIDRSAGPDACHPWTGARDKDGYGKFWPARGVAVGAHRLALMLKLGRDFAPGEETRHVGGCQVRTCCNQRHLEPGTKQQNIADREAAGTTQKGAKHWKARLTAENVIEIRRRAPREKLTALAAEFGVSPEAIGKVVRGENWKHLLPAALVAGALTIRKARALFGVTALMQVAS